MINNTVGELAGVMGAEAVLDGRPADPQILAQPVTNTVADSRLAGPGSLFVALGGERVDGHDFAVDASSAGAVAAVTARPVAGVFCLLVDDPLRALGAIGQHVTAAAKQGGLQVIGITGSAGKTSTKDLLAQILEPIAPVVSPQESMNNEVGVPLTASRCTGTDRFLISEMGAKGIGHIRYLCELTPPDVGVELNVGIAHLGQFGDQETIATAKAELVEALSSDGVAVLNATDERVQTMASHTPARVINFAVRSDGEDAAGGTASNSAESESVPDPVASSQVLGRRLVPDDLDRWRFELLVDGFGYEVQLGLVGRHQVPNAVAAAAAAHAVGVPASQIAAGLNEAGARSHWRMELHQLATDATVINDAYNANPTSMGAALDTLHNVGTKQRSAGREGRTIAILGEMLELGGASWRMHCEVGAAVAENAVDLLIGVGGGADPIIEGARAAGMSEQQTRTVPDADAAGALLGELAEGDVVLVKASRDIGLEVLADRLIADQPSRPGS